MRLVLLLLPMVACGTPATTAPVEPPLVSRQPGGLLLATYNLNFGNRTLDEAAHQVARVDPDLVCFEETTPQAESALHRAVGARYPHTYFVPPDAHWLASGIGCMSRWPFTARYVPRTAGLFGFLVLDVTAAGRPLRVVAVHLAPPLLGSLRPGLAELRQAMEAMQDTHALELPPIQAELPAGQASVLLGDFNSAPAMYAASTLRQRLTDSWAAAHPQDRERPTWEWPVALGFKVRLRLDYIFHSPELVTRASWILGSAGSDHRMVVSELAWR